MTTPIGYSLAIFGGDKSQKLYRCAVNADSTSYGGNENGLLDGKEIEIFTGLVKQKYNIDFDFTNIKQATLETISIFEGNQRKYKYFIEVNRDYKSSLTKTMETLNQYHDFTTDEAKEYYKKNGLKIAYMSDDDYKKSVKSVQDQEYSIDAPKRAKQARAAVIKDLINKKYGNAYNFEETSSEDFIAITVNRETTLGQIKADFVVDDGKLIEKNPGLKNQLKRPNFFQRLDGATRDFDTIVVKPGTPIYINIDDAKIE